ncbi:MAG: LysR family transcriptional regulator, partial [Anaerotignum sp.]|nr:LysR family transcriptional regulator [Anaerotignum sp.]
MRSATSIYLFKDDVRFFGEGPCRLLRGIQECGSLRAAALKMNLSYSKAITMINRAEEALGFPLTEKQIGGKGGGGSIL